MSFKVMDITPSIARDMLANNQENRRLNASHVFNLASQMESGEWDFNGDPIRFSSSGKLIDGQHRLNAILKSGKTIKCLVVDGLSESSFDTIDTGKARNAADLLSVKKTSYPSEAAAIARVLITLLRSECGTAIPKGTKITNRDVLRFVEQNPSITYSAKATSKKGGMTAVFTKRAIGACHFCFRKTSAYETEKFFKILHEGGELNEPANNLREFVTKKKLAGISIGLNEQLSYMCKAFTEQCNGDIRKMFRPSPDAKSQLLIMKKTLKETA